MFDGISRIVRKVFGDANERELKRIRPLVARINELESTYEALSDDELRAKTAEWKQQASNGRSLDEILPDAFAVCREGSKRALGMRHFDVQLIGGIVLHQGKIAEMKTGEGKTLVATLPTYLNALEGKGVHVITVNDYLAARDADWMGRLHRFLGLSVGKILSNERSDKIKRDAYASDITYGTNNEFGFDYLRDNMKFNLEQFVQRQHHYAIVDEVDSILIDEARTPLIISGPAEASVELYNVVDGIIPLLQAEIDFAIDEKSKNATLTEAGVSKLEQKLGVDNLYDIRSQELLHHAMQSLKAHHLFKRDKDYVVENGEVVIVDEFRGRKMPGRRWSDGLHQAIEAKERVPVQPESQTYATVTFQNYFRMYKKLSGMTGTAETEAAEFASIYNLYTIVIPTNRLVQRKDLDDIVYKSEMGKFRAVVQEIEEYHKRGQPVLVGTTSVEKSERLGELLKRKGIPHQVLNAKNHVSEAYVVSQAGRKGSVTISTNMAGRGTDIKLGGSAEEMTKLEADPELQPEAYLELLARHEQQCRNEAEQVKQAGGLHIIGTERHESRRVDNQLRGRAGRQGDPGSSRFFLSLEDDLLRMFGSDRMTVWMERMGLKEDEPIEHRLMTGSIENAQKKVESVHFQSRKNVLEYDDVMNYQRKAVYDLRRRALAGENIQEIIDEAVNRVVDDIMEECAEERLNPAQWDAAEIRKRLQDIFGIVWEDTDEQIRDHARFELRQRIDDNVQSSMKSQLERVGEERFFAAARQFLLQFTDQLWKDHLLAIERLRQGVSLRGYGQRNPLLEYKREAYHMFLYMAAIRDESFLQRLCQLVPQNREGQVIPVRAAEPERRSVLKPTEGFVPIPSFPSSSSVSEPAQPRLPRRGEEAIAAATAMGIRKNDPCTCGSGVKFKRCCGEGLSEAQFIQIASAAQDEENLPGIAEMTNAMSAGEEIGEWYDAPEEVVAVTASETEAEPEVMIQLPEELGESTTHLDEVDSWYDTPVSEEDSAQATDEFSPIAPINSEEFGYKIEDVPDVSDWYDPPTDLEPEDKQLSTDPEGDEPSTKDLDPKSDGVR